MASAIYVRKIASNKWSVVCCFRYRFMAVINPNMQNIKQFSIESVNHNIYSENTRDFQSNPLCLPSKGTQTLITGPSSFPRRKIKNLIYSGKSSFPRKLGFGKSDVACQTRNYSDGDGSENRGIPKLMDFPTIMFPSLLKIWRNKILAHFIITPYFDPDFNLQDFVSGSKQALEYVSGCLVQGDFDSLHGLVTEDALQEVKKNISTFSIQQRQMLEIAKDDIYILFPYQIGVMFNDDDKNQQRFVEITMVYHTLRGLKMLQEQGQTSSMHVMDMGVMSEYKERIMICNYRFVREFTKGVDSQWTVNVINYFRPVDL